MPRHLGDVGAHLVWRCHIDLSTPNAAVLDLLAPALAGYDAAIFHLPEFVPAGVALRQPITWPPAIDPLAPKNMALAREDAAFITRQFGLDVERPSMLQVSRFDPWKDPLGVIDAYRQVRRDVPELQLALVGAMAHDDPEGLAVYQECLAHADRDPNIIILSNMDNVGAVEVNAFQCLADVVVQKSLREGFGLTVSEALWKGRPTVGGAVGGIRLQIEQGVTGWLVDSPESCAEACLEVLRDPDEAHRIALGGQGARAAQLPDPAPGAGLAAAVDGAARGHDVRRGARPDRAGAVVSAGPRRRLLVASNRGPVSYGREGGQRTVRRGGGGLVTALAGLVAAHDVTWIAAAIWPR